MRKREPWGLIIVDHDRGLYAFTGVISDDGPWHSRINEARQQGRDVTCFAHKPSNDHNMPEWEQRMGLSRTSVDALLRPPEDNSAVYTGKLPRYAVRADRKRVVRILCRRSGKTRWAELTADYPGKDALEQAAHGKFYAICLRCGSRASDNYNWRR